MTRVLISLFCLGAAQQSVDETIEYVKMRKAFGMPIARYQAVSHPLVDAIGTINALRWFCYHVLWLREQEQKHAGLAGLVKAQVPKKAARIIQECLTINGHYAYTNELPLERRLRDVIGFQLGDGTEQIGRDVAVREFIGREHLSRW